VLEMNSVSMLGNLTRDPEVRPVGSTHVASFTVAMNRKFKRADGTYDEEVSYIPCEAWDTGAKTIEKLFRKGSQIFVVGALKQENWEKDGEKKSRLVVRVSNFQVVDKKPSETKEEVGAGVDAGAGAGNSGDEDIPF